MKLYPFKLTGVNKSPIWGGTRLITDWGKAPANGAETIGECWELTVRKQENSVIQNGSLAGKTLAEVIQTVGWDFVAPDYCGEGFPLLVKLIDAADRLSVQVHPNDDYAARVENDRGKTEVWYIVEADEGAEIICGLADGATNADFSAAVREGDPDRVLKHVPVHAGETYFIPAGLAHAIGSGILIAEIQQNCDLTYRVYDYDRRGTDGMPRELHVEKAMDVVRPFSEEEIEAIRYARRSDTLANGESLTDCAYFRVERVQMNGTRPLPACDRMRHLLCIGGEGTLLADGETYAIRKGDSYCLPAMNQATLTGNMTLLFSGV